jgi:protocatechuate 3,4-dioxygenase beta subunit
MSFMPDARGIPHHSRLIADHFTSIIPAFAAVSVLATGVLAAFAPSQSPAAPARDTPGQRKDVAAVPTGRIAGHVIGGDNGRAITRARVAISAPDLPEGRAALTDDSGAFEFTELPPSRYTLTVSKTGYVPLSYGQRRPLQAGTPLQLAGGQEVKNIEFRLPRGSVIAGHVYDENGDLMPGTTVNVMRYQYAQGNRQLGPAGTSHTDDRGEYRVWGLEPGDYYVSAVARNVDVGPGGHTGPAAGGGGDGRGGGGPTGGGPVGGAPAASGSSIAGADLRGQYDPEQLGYAPTYYPGVSSPGEARRLAVGLSAEVLDINFNVLLVRTSSISGHVTNPDGSATTAGSVNLAPEGVPERGRGFAGSYGGTIEWDGAFSIVNVPPGRYVLRARADDSEVPLFAMQPLGVDGDLDGLNVLLAPGAMLTGTVSLQATKSTLLPDISQFRITTTPTDLSSFGPTGNARVDKDGSFTIGSVPAGSRWIRAQSPRGWMLASVLVDGHEMVDTPVELRSSQHLDGISLLFTDNLAGINGTVTDEQGAPITEYTVLAFPADPALWRPLARQIMTTRPDQNGRFQLRGLPPGEYFVAAVDPAEQGEWFEPAFLDDLRPGAVRLVLGEGDIKTHDFRIRTR